MQQGCLSQTLEREGGRETVSPRKLASRKARGGLEQRNSRGFAGKGRPSSSLSNPKKRRREDNARALAASTHPSDPSCALSPGRLTSDPTVTVPPMWL